MEAELKKQLMEQEFQYNMELAKIAANAKQESENSKEDRKDQRTKIQATQQSEMISQRKNDGDPMNFEDNQAAPSNFESMGNDNLGNMGLDQFEPQ